MSKISVIAKLTAAEGKQAELHDAITALIAAADTGHPAFAREDDLVTVRREHPPEQLLVGSEAVERGGVEQPHPRLHRREQQSLRRLLRRLLAVRVAEVHAPEAERGDLERPEASRCPEVAHAPPRSAGCVASCSSSSASTR